MSETSSLRSLLRECPPEELQPLLAETLPSLTDEECDALLHDWEGLWARPEQLTPLGDWRTWLLMTGRGWGKTKTGAQWVRDQLLEMEGCRVAIVARTFADGRDTCVEGESGLLSCFTEAELDGHTWNRSIGEGRLANGSSWKIFSSEEPDSLRGPQFHVLWADELAAWLKHRAAWEQVGFVVRLPWWPDPSRAGRVVVTTTPRPVKELRELLADKTTHITRGTSDDNWGNLNDRTKAKLEKLKGTRIGRQELNGELLDDTPGALWTRKLLDEHRCSVPAELTRIVVGVDPAASSGENAAETGIIVAGKGPAPARGNARRYILDDRSKRGKPHEWALAAIQAYDDWKADAIVVEVNNGGEMCAATIRAAAPGRSLRIVEVHASRGKRTRAEPQATAYEAHGVFHAGIFAALEDQMCTWVPDDDTLESPDRMDAAVWALTALEGESSGKIERELPEPPERTGLAAEAL